MAERKRLKLPYISQACSSELNQLATKYFQLLRSKGPPTFIKRRRDSGYRGRHALSPIKTPCEEPAEPAKPLSTLFITPTSSFARLDCSSQSIEKGSRDNSVPRGRLSDLSSTPLSHKESPFPTKIHRRSPIRLDMCLGRSNGSRLRLIRRKEPEPGYLYLDQIRRLIPRAASTCFTPSP